MISVKIDTTSLGPLGRRIAKFLGYGLNDVRTATQVTPHGVDSNPVKNMVAVYAPLGNTGNKVILGYFNVADILKAAPGETRLYSTDANGSLQFDIYLRDNGTCEIGGNADNLVRFAPLKDAIDEINGKLNDLVTAFNAHTHPGVTPGGGSTGPPPVPAQSSTANIAPAKIDEIKTLA